MYFITGFKGFKMTKNIFYIFILKFFILIFFINKIAFADSLLIKNINLIDGSGAPLLSNINILVENGRIVKISSSSINLNKNIKIIDGEGKFLIPGLIDSHIHLPGGRTGPGNKKMVLNFKTGKKFLESYLYSGVTSVYDSNNNPDYIFKLRADERSGSILSPRIFATLSLVAPPGGHGCCAGGIPVNDFSYGKERLEELFLLKPDLLKFTRESRGMGAESRNLPLMDKGLFKRLISFSHENNLRVTVHVSENTLASEAIEAGADAFAHIPYIDPITDGLIDKIVKNGIILSTTITRVENDSSYLDREIFKDTVDIETIKNIKLHERFGTPKDLENLSPLVKWIRSVRAILIDNIKRLHEKGAIIALGTDRPLGPILHYELELIVEAGVNPIQAIKMATLNSAKYIGVDDDLGSIEEGKIADMVILNSNPLDNITNTTSIDSVYKGGIKVNRSLLDVPINRLNDG